MMMMMLMMMGGNEEGKIEGMGGMGGVIEEGVGIQTLSVEMLLHVFAHVECPATLLRCACVCRAWSAVLHKEAYVWRCAYLNHCDERYSNHFLSLFPLPFSFHLPPSSSTSPLSPSTSSSSLLPLSIVPLFLSPLYLHLFSFPPSLSPSLSPSSLSHVRYRTPCPLFRFLIVSCRWNPILPGDTLDWKVSFSMQMWKIESEG